MAGYDPWLVGLLVAGAAAIGSVALSIVWLVRLYSHYGLAQPPEEILQMDRALRAGHTARVDLAPYTFDRERNGRATHRRTLHTREGRWDLTVELEGDELLAYQARLTHAASQLMNYTVQGWAKPPNIIQEDGCG